MTAKPALATTNDAPLTVKEVVSTKPPARKSKLLAVSPETVEPKKPKILLYGGPGIGKTWFSLSFPGCFYCDTEGGADLDHYRQKLLASGGMYFGPDQGSLDLETVIGQVEALATETHGFKTIIFDSATKLFNSAVADEQQRLGSADVFGASRRAPIRQMGRLLSWVNRADMNAIFICHEKDKWGVDTKGNREAIGVQFDCEPKLEYDLHLSIRATKIGSGKNAVRFGNIGKSRLLGFPEGEKFELSYDVFAERFGRSIIEKEVVPVVLATPEQVTEINNLLDVVKLPEGETAKWLKKADVEKFEEMESATIQKCIQFLKSKIS